MRKRKYVRGLAYPVDEIVRILKLNTLTCEEIAVMFEYSESNIKRIARLYLTPEERRIRSSESYRRRGIYNSATRVQGPTVDQRGYIWVPPPSWWKGTVNNCRVQAHVLVCCKHEGLDSLPKGYVVHHKNKNKADNRWHNLQLMTNADHLALHREERSARCKANKV